MFKESVQAGITNKAELRELHSNVWAKYGNGFCKQYIADKHRRRPDKPIEELYPWPKELNTRLEIDPMLIPYDREILFICENKGRSGKSTFARYYKEKNHKKVIGTWPDGVDRLMYVQIVEPGKKCDMAHVIHEDTNVLFLDISRQMLDIIRYDVIESFKNRLVFDPKYGSKMKSLDYMHIVVIMNELPVKTAM